MIEKPPSISASLLLAEIHQTIVQHFERAKLPYEASYHAEGAYPLAELVIEAYVLGAGIADFDQAALRRWTPSVAASTL